MPSAPAVMLMSEKLPTGSRRAATTASDAPAAELAAELAEAGAVEPAGPKAADQAPDRVGHRRRRQRAAPGRAAMAEGAGKTRAVAASRSVIGKKTSPPTR